LWLGPAQQAVQGKSYTGQSFKCIKYSQLQAAMAEMMAKKTNQPTDILLDAYEQWSQGGWGSILTGT
jgi:hypothetical protein